jgi:large subunit ribosomal protein L25
MNTDDTVGKLTATRRRETGKGSAHKLRERGLIPAVCYGQRSEAISLTLDPDQLRKALDPGRKRNTVIDLIIEDDGKTEQLKVMLKDYQIDSVKQTLIHADFIRVSMDQVIEVSVPLELTGRPEGVKQGGTLHQVFRTLDVSCKPAEIPTALTADVSALELNDSLQVKNIETPAGVKVSLPENQTVALVMAPRKGIEEEEEAAAAEEGEGAEGAEAAGEGAEDKEKGEKDREKGGAKEKGREKAKEAK